VDPRTLTGRTGEAAAETAYARRGYRVVARNWRCRLGEIDLVLSRGDVLVFCEVKTRRGGGFGAGWEAVDARKQAKIRAVAQAFLLGADRHPASIRFDVASVRMRRRPSGSEVRVEARVEVYEDAF
jgi:putative endonuclease